MLFPQKQWQRSSLKNANINEDVILEFFKYAIEQNMNLHAIKIVKDGYLVLDAYKHPFDSEAMRDIYSVAKSFLSVAVGIAVDKGLISLDDHIISFFPDKLDKQITDVSKLTIKHLLTMSSGQKEDDWMNIWGQDDWIKAYLHTPVYYKPGTKHIYNNFNSFILSAIIQKVSGMRLIDFLYNYFFSKVGITRSCWSQHNNNIDFGASGFYANTDAMVRFGHCILNYGNWNGEQLISKDYIKNATSKQIESKQWDESTSWASLNHGYGYHFWINKFGGFSARGMLGQDIVMLRKYNLVVALHGDRYSSKYELFDLISDYIVLACEKGYDKKNPELPKIINQFMNPNTRKSYIPNIFTGNKKLFKLDKPLKYGNIFTFLKTDLEAIGFKFSNKALVVEYHNNRKKYSFRCGLNGKFLENEVISIIGGDEINLRYSLRGKFIKDNHLKIEIQPITHAMRLIHEVDFIDENQIRLKSYLYNKKKDTEFITFGSS